VSICPAKVHHFFRIEAGLKENPANLHEFLTFTAKKEVFVHKSCIIAGFYNNRRITGKNDVFSHYF